MATSHHGSNQDELWRRFQNQASGQDARTFSGGRIGPDDDGDFTYAIATDKTHGVIRIQFPYAVPWIALDYETAEQLRDTLSEKMLELRGITK